MSVRQPWSNIRDTDEIEKMVISLPCCFHATIVSFSFGTHSQFLKTEKADEDKSGELEELERKFADIEEAVKLASYQVHAFGSFALWHSVCCVFARFCL